MRFHPIQVKLDAEHYAAIRTQARQAEISIIAPALLTEVHEWLTRHRIATTGPALIRFLSIDSVTGTMDIHVGFPIAHHTPMHERVEFAVKPAGTYVIVVHRGPHNSLHKSTAMLLAWAKEHGVSWQYRGPDEWTGWFEHYLIGPSAESDPSHWHTEIAILRAD